jgi:spermidine synthase
LARWELLDTAPVPGGTSELRLYQRADVFAIRVPGFGELMNSRTHGSEDALGTLACERVHNTPSARVLVGGLGMGFTLATSLATLASDATVVVAELVPQVVEWNRGELGACAGRPLDDTRVQIEHADVAELIRNNPDSYDAILLDVDNGPEGLTRRANDALYTLSGVSDAYNALRPGGTVAVWSAGPDRVFPARLAQAGFAVEERVVRAHAGKGSRHFIWFAKRPK